MLFSGIKNRLAFFLVTVAISVNLAFSCSPATIHVKEKNIEAVAGALAGKKAEVDIDQLISSMTPREKVAQLMFVWGQGSFQTDDSQRFTRLKRLVTEEKIGGLIFAGGDVYGQAMLTNQLQQLVEIPLWITQDMEFGAAMRITGTTRFPPAMGIAATGNTEHAYQKGRITALESRAIGVHQIFAPVVDVNNNPGNPVINTRSFSEDPHIVSVFADAFIRGAQDAGSVATAKHFPGHGDTNVDSHLALPVISHDYARLNQLELIPFRSAVRSGVKSIMSAHIAFPLIGDPRLPGTLDPAILTSILRDSLKFEGIIATDALEMDGIRLHYAPGEAAVKAILAGADMLLLSPDIQAALDEAEKAVKNGIISEERLNESVRRILELKKEHGLFDSALVDVNTLSSEINKAEYRLLGDEAARASITVLKNAGNILPVKPHRHGKITVIAIADDRGGNTGNQFARALREYHPDVTFHVYDQRSSDQDLNRMIESARTADLVIVGSFIFVQTSNQIEMNNAQKRFLGRIKQLQKPVIMASFGNPYVVKEYPEANVHLLAWAATVQQMEAAAHAIFGASDVDGTLPITIPRMYERGHGIAIPQSVLRPDHPQTAGLHADSLSRIRRVIESAIRDEIFPGASVAVVRNGILAWHQGYGYHDYRKTEATRKDDVFDVASLTKVMATTLGVMKLVDEGRLSLDDAVGKYIPEFNSGARRNVTIYHLLSHTSGLPAFRVYVDEIKTRPALLQAIRNEPLLTTPGETYVYSDLGMILAALIIESVTGQALNVYLDRTFYTPMGMYRTTFNPSRRGRWFTDRILPTEIDTIYRKQTIRGVVHDERAFYLDGLAGHAGLFSTSDDVARFAQLLLNEGKYAGIQFLKPETVRTFTKRLEPHNRRALGFDMKSREGFSSAGTVAGDLTFGHTGFTGTSVWIDPDKGLAVILLTNRTWPYRGTAAGISRVRAEIADIVFNSIIE